MATAVKNLRSLQAAATSVSASATQTSGAWNGSTALAGLLTLKITNGTAPSGAPYVVVYTSGDNTNFKQYLTLYGDYTGSSVTEWAIDLPQGTMYAKVVFVANNQAMTVEAFVQELSSIG